MVTESMRTEYRRALMRGGVPEVYAHMAAKELTSEESPDRVRAQSASHLLWGGFVWCSTKHGHEFWNAIALEAEA